MALIIIINLILIVITVLLVIADSFLVTYGECKIVISQEGGKKEILVNGGGYLLPILTENKIPVSSSCGGKATCGYCKIRVVSGGGMILPTEEIFISMDERLKNVRLACQVKVKNDIEIYIPDYLDTVRDIVRNRSYNPQLKWNFIIGKKIKIPERIKKKLTKEDKTRIDRIIEEHRDIKGALIPILQKLNNSFNYLPEPALQYLAERMNLPLSMVYQVATFYNAFTLKPRGRNIIRVCLGTSCYVKGGKEILQTIERMLNIKTDGYPTKDLRFSLESVNCIGCCGQSPSMMINDEIYGYLRKDMIPDILRKYY